MAQIVLWQQAESDDAMDSPSWADHMITVHCDD